MWYILYYAVLHPVCHEIDVNEDPDNEEESCGVGEDDRDFEWDTELSECGFCSRYFHSVFSPYEL